MNKRYTLDWLTGRDLANLMRGLQLLVELNNVKEADPRENALLEALVTKIYDAKKER